MTQRCGRHTLPAQCWCCQSVAHQSLIRCRLPATSPERQQACAHSCTRCPSRAVRQHHFRTSPTGGAHHPAGPGLFYCSKHALARPHAASLGHRTHGQHLDQRTGGARYCKPEGVRGVWRGAVLVEQVLLGLLPLRACMARRTLVAGLVVEGKEHAWDGPSFGVAAMPVQGHKGLHSAIWRPGQLVCRPPYAITMPAVFTSFSPTPTDLHSLHHSRLEVCMSLQQLECVAGSPPEHALNPDPREGPAMPQRLASPTA